MRILKTIGLGWLVACGSQHQPSPTVDEVAYSAQLDGAFNSVHVQRVILESSHHRQTLSQSGSRCSGPALHPNKETQSCI